MKYKELIDITQEELEKQFPWLKAATFEDAVIKVSDNILIWKDGIWKDGIWKDGIWENGIWRGGIFEGGRFLDGIWAPVVKVAGDGVWKCSTWKNGVMVEAV